MDLFSLYRSKRTSETGVWINDEDVLDCPLCGVKFSLLQRKHHCRQCGNVVCKDCSSHRKFLESSRTGAPKRICDTCHRADAGTSQQDDDEEDAEDEDTAKARAAMKKLKVGGAGASASAGSSSSGGGSGSGGGRLSTSVRLPDISVEESVAAIAAHPFDGQWKFTLSFATVDLGAARTIAATAPGVDVATFKTAAASAALGKKGATLAKDGTVRVGSRLNVVCTLKTRSGGYFAGETGDFGQFGKGGKVNGSLQRSSGKVAMTLQIINAVKTTTSFNFTGMMNSDGAYIGTFSGTEISRTAGTVTGGFRGVRITEEAAAEEEKRAGAGGDDDDDEAEEDEPADGGSDSDSEVEARRKKAAAAAAKKTATSPSSAKAAAAKKPAAASKKKKAADSDEDSD